MNKRIIGNTTTTPMPIPDWNQTNPAKADFIKNKPDIQAVNDAIGSLSTLVGDTAVSEQINISVAAIQPKITSITVFADSWVGDTNPWSQVVSVNGITKNSRVDLRATALQIVDLQDNDIAFIAENDDGVITVYALGSKPSVDYTIQAEITEVIVV